jgi:hypothetical protein
MNFLNKKALLALAFLGFNGSMFGYEWNINNKTDKPIIVEMVLQGDIPINHRYFRIAEPGRPAKFNFGGGKIGFCYKSIRIAEWKTEDATAYAAKFKLSAADRDTLLAADTKDIYHVSDPVKYFFWEYTMFHTPEIIYPKNSFDTSKIVDAMTAIGSSAEKTAELIAKAAAAPETGGASASAPSLDLGLGTLMGSITGLIVEGVEKGGCGNRSLDVYGLEIKVPGTKGVKTEDAYIFVNRQN